MPLKRHYPLKASRGVSVCALADTRAATNSAGLVGAPAYRVEHSASSARGPACNSQSQCVLEIHASCITVLCAVENSLTLRAASIVEMRIKATGNIAKITKAMKMVAAAKLRQVQEKNELARPFTEGAKSFLEPYQEVIDGLPEERALKHMVIPLTGDRGLCGSINTNIGKYVKAMLETDDNDEVTVIAIGQKAQDAMAKMVPEKTVTSFRDVGKVPMNFSQACVCAEDIVNAEFDKATIVFTTFKNALTQTPTSFTVPSKSLIEEFPQALEDYEFDTDNEAMLSMEDLVEFQLASLCVPVRRPCNSSGACCHDSETPVVCSVLWHELLTRSSVLVVG
jgi:F-type H+-transporting ATPase subunit gamma